MTLIICLILLVPLGVAAPKVVVRRMPTTFGVVLGVALALGLGAVVVWLVATGVATATGADSKLAFESGFNAWKLLIFLSPAAGIHYRRLAGKTAETAPDQGDA